MRSPAKWIQWWFVSMIGAAVGVLLGLVVVVVVYPLVSFPSFFLLVFLGGLAIVAFGLVGAAGGSVDGIMIGSLMGLVFPSAYAVVALTTTLATQEHEMAS